jgi:hypothetical protein
MTDRQFCVRMLAYAKASLLRSLEKLTQEDLLWQPAAGKSSIGWNACHVGQFRSSLMWFFDPEPNWESIGPLLHFGYESRPDELRDQVPPRAKLIELIHEDWRLFLERFAQFADDQFAREVPLNNPDGETLIDMCHRTAWHCEHHVGRICGLRSLLGKPAFPRPMFGTRARQKLLVRSESRWEEVLQAVDW